MTAVRDVRRVIWSAHGDVARNPRKFVAFTEVTAPAGAYGFNAGPQAFRKRRRSSASAFPAAVVGRNRERRQLARLRDSARVGATTYEREIAR